MLDPLQPALFDSATLAVDFPSPHGCPIHTERELLAVAVALGAASVAGWSGPEAVLTDRLPAVEPSAVERFRATIRAGLDPLGSAFCALRSAETRRQQGATYTPFPIVESMVEWAARQAAPARVVDPGAGSGRFLLAAGRRFQPARLVGIELDPVAAVLARANLAAAGFAERAEVILADYRTDSQPPIDGRTLYIGNPPYVRHHLIAAPWKQWLTDEASRRGLSASQLAGLHVHFFLATVARAQPQDFGSFITSAEWLDVNYGSLVRELFLGELGGQALVVIEPSALPFPDALTTAAISYFVIGTRPKAVAMKRVASQEELAVPNGHRKVRRERLEVERRWSHLTRPSRKGPSGYVELGELCRVHRGQVTGANRVWIAGRHSEGLPDCVLFPTVTKARELFSAGKTLSEAASLTSGRLRADPEMVKRIVHVVLLGLDRRRFPWVQERREPEPMERNAAIVASAALMATRRVGTQRANQGKSDQEKRVEDALADAGWKKVPRRNVVQNRQAPEPGEFCLESKLGTRKADFILRLWDDRMMPIECKVSNSALNSVKRLNNDAAVKAEVWRQDFGRGEVIPAAVLSGVYKLPNLEEAQSRGLTLFWAHDLKEMLDWIDATRRR